MPRRRLTNEQDAVNLLADCAVRASRGNMPAHQLHAITSAMATYSNLLKTRRDEELRQEISRQIDEMGGSNNAFGLHLKKKLTPRRR